MIVTYTWSYGISSKCANSGMVVALFAVCSHWQCVMHRQRVMHRWSHPFYRHGFGSSACCGIYVLMRSSSESSSCFCGTGKLAAQCGMSMSSQCHVNGQVGCSDTRAALRADSHMGLMVHMQRRMGFALGDRRPRIRAACLVHSNNFSDCQSCQVFKSFEHSLQPRREIRSAVKWASHAMHPVTYSTTCSFWLTGASCSADNVMFSCVHVSCFHVREDCTHTQTHKCVVVDIGYCMFLCLHIMCASGINFPHLRLIFWCYQKRKFIH